MAAYFPDSYPKGRQCDRVYFFTVLGTLHPEYARALILKAKENRYQIDMAEQKADAIVLEPDWEAQLKEFPQLNRKYTSPGECKCTFTL